MAKSEPVTGKIVFWLALLRLNSSFQWIFQGGRWQRFELSTLMGTNYVIWRDALETLGGFDEKSLVDDTEMSFRIFIGQNELNGFPMQSVGNRILLH